MGNQEIYHDLEGITDVAIHLAKEHNCNYNVIISNHKDGKYDKSHGSTYEMVADSYFEKERPYAVLVSKTDDLIPTVQEIEPIEGLTGTILDQFEEPFMFEDAYHGLEEVFQTYPTRKYQAPIVKDKKIGRNELCSCDSGKKYKKCCI